MVTKIVVFFDKIDNSMNADIFKELFERVRHKIFFSNILHVPLLTFH